jgi:hypothetical protein
MGGIMPGVPSPARELGLAGLVPFVVLAATTWLAVPEWHARTHDALLGYGAVILSFMGAVHWGLAMAGPRGRERAWQLGLSVVPALLGWLALLLPVGALAYSVLLVAFAALCLVDTRATKAKLAPAWYPALRVPLTTVVVACLIAAALRA